MLEVGAFPHGAGSGICVDGTPGGPGSESHGRRGDGDGGFSLAFSPTLPDQFHYSPGTTYTITLSGGGFMGFAIVPLTSKAGVFIPGANSKTLAACTDHSNVDGLTHYSSDAKTFADATWTAPANGTVKLSLTVLGAFRGTWFSLFYMFVEEGANLTLPSMTASTTPMLDDGRSRYGRDDDNAENAYGGGSDYGYGQDNVGDIDSGDKALTPYQSDDTIASTPAPAPKSATLSDDAITSMPHAAWLLVVTLWATSRTHAD